MNDSTKILQKLEDLIEMQRHILTKINLIEIEIKTFKDNSPMRINNLIEKAEAFEKELGKKIQKEIFTPLISNKGNYQKGSLDEKIILNFLSKGKEVKIINLEENIKEGEINKDESEKENE